MRPTRIIVLGLFGAILATALFGCATSDQKNWWARNESQRPDLSNYPYMPYTDIKEAKPAAPAPTPVIRERAE